MSAKQTFVDTQSRILRTPRLLFLLYGFNLLFSAVLLIPFSNWLEKVSKTAFADDFVNGFNIFLLADLFSKHGETFAAIVTFALIAATGYLVLNTFFAGGILGGMGRDGRFNLRQFFLDCAEFFGRFFRLFLISLLSLGVLSLLLFLIIILPLNLYKDGLLPDAELRVNLVILFFVLVMLIKWNMLFDYAKIALFSNNLQSGFRAIFSAGGFIWQNKWGALGLYLMNLGVFILASAAYFSLESQIDNVTATQTYILVGFQQIYMISRMWVKISFFGSQQRYYAANG